LGNGSDVVLCKFAGEEKKFLDENSGARRLRFLESITTRAYSNHPFIFLFSKDDGHLAFRYNLATGKVEYECDCIRKGKKIFRRFGFPVV